MRLITRVGEVATRGWRRLRDIWHRSIQVRVISATLALSLVVVGILGATMLSQISDNLVDAKEESSLSEARAGIREMQAALDVTPFDEANSTTLQGLVIDRARLSTVDAKNPLFHVVLLGSFDVATRSDVATRADLYESVPQAMQEQVSAEPNLAWTYASIDGTDGETPALVVGARVTAPDDEAFGLYYVFPMTETQDAIDVVTAAVSTAGILLILLLGTLAWLVTRQVVTPVRLAAQVAGRFSAGELSERMVVRGTDDIAKLADSFNHMAGSLQRQIGQLEELSRVQQQFVSDVSHELRTPITTVRMAADVLYETKEQFDPSVQRSIELLQTQLDRFEALLTDLLEISRFDAGAAVLHAEPQDIRDVIIDVAEAAKPLATRKGCEIVLDLPDEPCVTEFDARRIQRVLRNLVVNAVEHGEGNDVVVTAGADDDAVAITVRDYGVGLKPGESSLVFHRFWRADPARARTTGGSGLGLSIALEDAKLHGGWLQAWGDPGEGSQFRLTLPREAGVEFTSSPLPLTPADSPQLWSRSPGVGEPYQTIVPSSDAGSSSPPSEPAAEEHATDAVADPAVVDGAGRHG